MKKCFLAFLLLGILVFLLLFPEAALFASRRGLDLWFGTLVPTLLPFLILSGFLIHSGLVQIPASPLQPLSSEGFSGFHRLEAMPVSPVFSAAVPWEQKYWRISPATAG